MKTIIYTSFDCLIKTHSSETFLSANNNLSFDNFPDEAFVYPTGNSKIIPFKIDFQTNSPFYQTIEKDGKLLVFLLDGLYVQGVDIHSFSNNGTLSTIEVSNKEIIFSTKEAKKVISLPHGFTNCKCGNVYHINYAICDSPKGKTFFAFNTKNCKLKAFEGNTIEQNNNTFVICNDEEKQELYIDKEGLKIKDKIATSNIYSNPLYPAKNFMQALKAERFSDALSLLSQSLQESQDERALKEYFGEISFVLPIDLHTVFALSNGRGKIYSFQLDKGKIVDISD